MNEVALWRRLLAELLGSAFLAAVVIGSGIAAQQLSPHNVGLELFENAAATATGLFAIILMFGPISGGHFNPVVSLVDAAFGGMSWRDSAAYSLTQITGCIGGAVVANVMFSHAAVAISTRHRASGGHFVSEIVATLGLLLVIFGLARSNRSHVAPAVVGAYIGSAYFFTSSTSFANPAITVGRMFSDTFAGIAPASVPSFIVAQVGRRRGRVLRHQGALSGRSVTDLSGLHFSFSRSDAYEDTMTKTPVVLFLCTHNAGRSARGQSPSRALRRRVGSTSARRGLRLALSSTRPSLRSSSNEGSTRLESSPHSWPTTRRWMPMSS